jgi:hypothetical protein
MFRQWGRRKPTWPARWRTLRHSSNGTPLRRAPPQTGLAIVAILAVTLALNLLAFATFFYALSVALTRVHMLAAYGGAIFCALAIQAVSLYRMRLPVSLSAE